LQCKFLGQGTSMLKIGLTGGIGSGKTTVAAYFGELGVPVIDADVISRALIEPGNSLFNRAAFDAIIKYFGVQILTRENHLSRKQLRQIVFNHPEKRHWLEQLLHPLIHAEIEQQVTRYAGAAQPSPYCVIVIPLLIEVGWETMVDRVVVIHSDLEQQIQRVAQRDNVHPVEVVSIMNAQASSKYTLAKAEDIIENNGSLEDLRAQVKQLHEFYSTMDSA
jgi:dephospho-CoA kinase